VNCENGMQRSLAIINGKQTMIKQMGIVDRFSLENAI
jgi:hypothetical protein